MSNFYDALIQYQRELDTIIKKEHEDIINDFDKAISILQKVGTAEAETAIKKVQAVKADYEHTDSMDDPFSAEYDEAIERLKYVIHNMLIPEVYKVCPKAAKALQNLV